MLLKNFDLQQIRYSICWDLSLLKNKTTRFFLYNRYHICQSKNLLSNSINDFEDKINEEIKLYSYKNEDYALILGRKQKVNYKKKIGLRDFYFDISIPKVFYCLSVMLSFFVFSCSKDVSKYANVKIYDGGKSFAFIISDELSKKVKNSPIDIDSKMTKKETKILEFILKNKNLCLISSKPSYIITTKQEKIYDITYATLIEENYNAKPITPTTYFGKCNSSK